MILDSTPDGPHDDPPSATRDIARLRLQLRNRSLADLEDAELVVWDRDKHIVRKGPRFEDDCPPLRDD